MAPILTEFTFTGMTHEGSKVRVYATLQHPGGQGSFAGHSAHPRWRADGQSAVAPVLE